VKVEKWLLLLMFLFGGLFSPSYSFDFSGCSKNITVCVHHNSDGVCTEELMASSDYGDVYTNQNGTLNTFKNVIAYTNGNLYGKFYYAGTYKDANGNDKDYPHMCYTYQCVALAQRFYSQFFGIDLGSVSSAINIFTEFGDQCSQHNLKRLGMEIFQNGGNVAPRMGDMIVFSGGSDGHVAIFCGIASNGKAHIF
jgi:hypothetical protein